MKSWNGVIKDHCCLEVKPIVTLFSTSWRFNYYYYFFNSEHKSTLWISWKVKVKVLLMYAVQSILCFLIIFLSICFLVDHLKQEVHTGGIYIFSKDFVNQQTSGNSARLCFYSLLVLYMMWVCLFICFFCGWTVSCKEKYTIGPLNSEMKII